MSASRLRQLLAQILTFIVAQGVNRLLRTNPDAAPQKAVGAAVWRLTKPANWR
jgi:hypothetical protein